MYYVFSYPPRNVTIPDVSWEQQCRDVESVRPNCVTNYETQNMTVTEQVCNDVMVEECYNYTVPTYEVVRVILQIGQCVSTLFLPCRSRRQNLRMFHL